MYSDLFDHLGSNAGGGGGSSSNSNEKQLVTFKAGKMDLTLQENGKYWAAPDTRRGEVRLVWKTTDSSLYWEWFDRREKSVPDGDRHTLWSVGGTVNNLGSLERVQDVPNAAPQDRLYVWSRPAVGGSSASATHHMYWMQDASEEKDDEVIAQVNQYLSDPASANPSSSSSGSGGSSSSNRGSSSSNNNNASSSNTDGGNNSSSDRQQVDALSNILENLGMPQSDSGGASAAAPAAAATGTLTLADLQGAMAGIQQQAAASGPPGPPLSDLVTPGAIASLLENDEVKARLLELLPENQRSEEFLEENLRSPQVQQTLRSLTAALLPDDAGSMDGYHSVLANFHMAEGAQEALQNNSNNPIQAFLECVLKSVEKEEAAKKDGEEGKKEEESKE